MNYEMILTFIILAITTLFFINGKIRSDLVALGSLLALVLTGIITAQEALAGFSNSTVLMIAGLFIVGAGIFRTGLAKSMGNKLLPLAGKSELKLLMIVIVVTAGFSGIMSNTGTVAVLLPVVMSMALDMKVSPSKFLIPLAYASSLGGVLTLIGTPPNMVVSQAIKDSGLGTLGFFDFFPIGLVGLFAGLIYMITIGRKILPDHMEATTFDSETVSPEELVVFYKLSNQIHRVCVSPNSKLVNQSLKDSKLRELYNITVVEIERKLGDLMFSQTLQINATANTVIEADDRLLLIGKREDVVRFIAENDLSLVTIEKKSLEENQLVTKRFGLAEMLITPHSKFLKRTLKDIRFREKYQLTVLAINRKGTYIYDNLLDVKIRFGDALLVHGDWKKIKMFAFDSNDVVVTGKLEEDESRAYSKGKAPIAAFNMVVMIILMLFSVVPEVIAVFISALLMVVTGCLRNMNEGYKSINWESVVLIAAMLPMSTALEKTGGVNFLSDALVHSLGTYGPYALLAGFYFVSMILSQFISNTATAVIFAPVAITTSLNLGLSPYPLLMSVAIAASMAFATPVATPPNALVMAAGGYAFKDYVKVGVPLQLFLMIVMLIFIPIFFPF
ncbi:SLC13 family permease [Calidifontibacillus oryziterrae]|uniref:SLC13 family permease n=1 Tax=Calidifontibacillus oryziterrae TaxID=1191699 RepID=UPI0003100CF1|nr:SLC13 family permease [Calidifontibacillus oryziterrae]